MAIDPLLLKRLQERVKAGKLSDKTRQAALNLLGAAQEEPRPAIAPINIGKQVLKNIKTAPERYGLNADFSTPEGQKKIADLAFGFMPIGELAEVGKVVEKALIKQINKFTPEAEVAINKITLALKEAQPIRKAQEAIYTATRGARIAESLKTAQKTSGEAGFIAEKAALKGEMPKVQFESVRETIEQPEIDALFDTIKNSQILNDWQKITAREGLAKVVGEFGGKVPTEGELILLNRVFPKEFVDAVTSKLPLKEKLGLAVSQAVNIPRAFMSSIDLSALLRQGLVLGAGHPIKAMRAVPKMIKAFGSEKAFKAIQESIVRMPTFDLMQEGKLALTELDSVLSLREEKFMSQWAEKIPVAGKMLRASSRAYTGLLNKLRADVFNDLITKAEIMGRAPRSNPKLVKEIANWVSIGSGRGSLGKLQPAAVALNAFFFSPRLMSSRLTMLNPFYYIKADPFVRKEALRSVFAVAGAGLTMLGLAKLAGADVESRMASSDFGKIKIKNTRIDLWGGFQQYVRSAAQVISGKYISSVTGKELTLGEGYKPLSLYDILLRQVEAKEAPIFSFITSLLKQQDYQGRPIDIPKEIGNRFVPMAIQDIIDLYSESPGMLPLSALGIFGAGLQTYQPTTKTNPHYSPFLPTPSTSKSPFLP